MITGRAWEKTLPARKDREAAVLQVELRRSTLRNCSLNSRQARSASSSPLIDSARNSQKTFRQVGDHSKVTTDHHRQMKRHCFHCWRKKKLQKKRIAHPQLEPGGQRFAKGTTLEKKTKETEPSRGRPQSLWKRRRR